MHAIRDEEFKFVIDFEKEEHLYAMPGEVPIDLESAGDEIQTRRAAQRSRLDALLWGLSDFTLRPAETGRSRCSAALLGRALRGCASGRASSGR